MTFQRHAAHIVGLSVSFDGADFNFDAGQLEAKYSPQGGGEHPAFSREDWQDAINSDSTAAGYWDWVADELQSNFSDLAAEDPEWADSIEALSTHLSDDLGAKIAETAETIVGSLKRPFQLLWASSTQDQRAALLSSPEMAAWIGAPEVYESEHGWGFEGCEADIYSSAAEAYRAAALTVLEDSDAIYANEFSPSM